MKVKLIDLGNAVPIDRTNIYYDDFEVQSIHYRAPEVLLGLPFNSSIDIFSLGLILAELLLSPIDPPPAIIPRVPSFPTSPPQSHSPPPLHCVPLLSTFNSNRRAFVEQMTRLFGPLPSIYHNAKFWSDEYAQIDVDIPLSQRMETDGVGPALIDFIMRMVELNPAQRISAREALRHEWIVGPMLGYWAVVGVEWTQPEIRNIMWKRPENQPTLEEDHPRERSPVLGLESFPPMKRNGTVESENVSVENVQRGGSVQSTSSSPEGHVESISRKPPPLYDFSAMQDSDEEDIDEVSQVLYSGSSPTKPLLYIEHKPPPPLEIEEPEMVTPLHDHN
jgi:serine/threonine protein kinase